MHLFGEEEVQRMEILAIQEPEVYGFGDAGSLMTTYSQALGGKFHVLLRPTLVGDGEDGKPRVCFYVNKKIDPKTWSVKHHSRDLSTLTVRTALGAMDIHNVYVPSKVGVTPADRVRVSAAIRESLTVLRTALHRGHLGRQVVVGDFNLHHPLWSTCRQARLQDADADELIGISGDHGLELLTERGMVTYHGNVFGHDVESTIDLTWASTALAERIVRCDAQRRWLFAADHLPVLTELDLRWDAAPIRELKNWKEADWDTWGTSVAQTAWPENINTQPDVDAAVQYFLDALNDASQGTVPIIKLCQRSKPGYTADLKPLRQQVNQARRWARSGDPAEVERFRRIRHELGRESKKVARSAHRERVAQATKDIQGFWRLSKWARTRGTPRSTHTPTLQADGIEYSTAADKAEILKKTLFPPAPRANTRDIDARGGRYPAPHPTPSITTREIRNTIERSAPNKAPGPDGIPNLALKHAIRIPAVLTFLATLFNACLSLGYCPRLFRESTTVVIRKPGKPDYTTPKAYRPIMLLCTLGKALESVIATRLSFLVEEYRLLPETHIGGRVGRSCDHALHLLLERVYEAWRQDDRVASLLTLDVSGAFDNVSHKRLIHCLRMRRIPVDIVQWITSFLSDRHTTLLLQEGDMGRGPVATGIPQGSPLSPILYLFYNADLIDTIHAAAPGRVLVTGYIDDICILVWSLSAAENCRLLTRLHQKAEVWARRHASIFAPAKYGLMHMWKKGVGARKPDTATNIPLMLNGVEIQPTSSLGYLGVELDENLTGRAQVDRCRKKAAALVAALRSIAGMTWGVNTLNLRRMWTAVLLPQIAFACSAWRTEGAYGMKGVEGTARRAMESIRYQALYKIAGAFRTTSRSALEICLYVPPVSITMHCLSEETCLRLHATPIESTPRTAAVHGNSMATAHRALVSPLQRLELHLSRKGIDVAKVERIRPFAVAPWWEPPETHIASTKEQAIQEHHRVIRETTGPNLAIGYTDGSGAANGVGASATTSRGDAITVLGTLETHTVYAAELEGIRLALQSFLRGDGNRNTDQTPRTATIFTDNQAAIRACAHPQRSSEALRGIGCHVRIRWIPGHVGVAGNERADRLANDAANTPTIAPPSTILLSGCRMKLRRIAFEHWTQEWADGEHGAYARLLFPLPTKAIFELHETLPRAASSALIQMQTGKIGLPGYLNTIPRWREEQLEANPLRDPARCSCDIGNQDTRHVLLTCPCFTNLRLRVLGPPPARAGMTWKDWLTKPASAVKAATFILKTRLLGQFRALPNTLQASRTGNL
ncbi:reverse transcriptase [Penicillium frequentans]|uniref:Reverse transcriptase n=1 Tax=Penicillium frequentans TaxID=3151616 RepID=A0AAD6GHG5_9EURO|nr:reverse transcriptase [Penicillium glabrum]